MSAADPAIGRRGRKLGFVSTAVLLGAWSLGPIIWIVLSSLKTRAQIIQTPPPVLFEPNLDGFRRALGPNGITDELANTVVISLTSTLLSLVLATMAAYAVSRYRFPGRTGFLMGMLGTRLFPPIAAVVPLFIVATDLDLVDTRWILILIYTALNVPFASWLLKSYIDAVPREIEEAATVDGASTLGVLWRITMPLMTPGLLATGVFIFVLAWNEFMFAFMFTSVEARTVPVVLSQAQGDEIVFWQDLAAQATLLILPALLLGFLMQRYLVRGLAAGAVK